MIGAVAFVARRRAARHWRALAAAGVLLGLGFGLCLASIAAARTTSSAYDRILVHADAPDAAVTIGVPPEPEEASLRAIDGITAQRVYAGFVGTADGVDPILTAALLAPTDDPFPIERPMLRAGRLPDPDAPDEALVNSSAAARGGIEVGQRLHFRLVSPGTAATAAADVMIVGIGTFPAEAVTDETNVLGLFVFTRAFYEAHRDVVVYAASNVDLAPGFDARRDLAPAVGDLGHQLQSARTQEQHAIDDALHPLVIVLVALGVLAFGGTTVAAGQVIQRTRDRWLADDARLRSLGMARGQIRTIELASSVLVAVLAVGVALVTMGLASPVGPIGPLHGLDPAQGFAIDATVAVLGAVAIVATIAILTVVFSSVRNQVVRPMLRRSRWLETMPGGPTTATGLTLALRTDDGHDRAWRAVAATTAAAAGLAMCAAFVVSAITVTNAPARYGFDADLLAVNAYGDQSETALEQAFGNRDDVVAATGYTAGSYLIDGRAVPGLAATAVKGELTPTIVRGRPPRSADEIVVGGDTLDNVAAEVGDVVEAQILTASGVGGDTAARPVQLRIVGVAVFPAVSQLGTDMPRLGVGALVTRDAFLRMHGDDANKPEFTMVRLTEGTDPTTVVAANPQTFEDAQSATAWFTDAKPAELRQLDAAAPYLRGALAVGFMILLAVIVHALWSRARANRHDLAVLRVIGCVRNQLDAVTAWQVTPFALGGVLIGIPFGVALGRLLFRVFAESLSVVDDPSTSVATVAALVVAVLLAAAVADLAAVAVARRTRAAVVLRQG